MNFVHGVFYVAIFRQHGATSKSTLAYTVARYVIVNITTAALESKTKIAWKRQWQKRKGNSLNSFYLGISNSFKDGSSKLNNHSAMAVGKFILVLSVQFEFFFYFTAVCPKILYENDMKLNYKNWQLIFFVSLRYEWKTWRAHQVFYSYLKETKEINTILKYM